MTTFHPKMTAAVLAGALTVVLVAEFKRRGIDIDGTEGSSITLIFSFLAGFFMPSDDAGNVGVSAGATTAAKPPARGSIASEFPPGTIFMIDGVKSVVAADGSFGPMPGETAPLQSTLPTALNTGVER